MLLCLLLLLQTQPQFQSETSETLSPLSLRKPPASFHPHATPRPFLLQGRVLGASWARLGRVLGASWANKIVVSSRGGIARLQNILIDPVKLGLFEKRLEICIIGDLQKVLLKASTETTKTRDKQTKYGSGRACGRACGRARGCGGWPRLSARARAACSAATNRRTPAR